ncbi:YhaN family protein [Consotaella salsifontis]|uniref:Uncharacterized protein YhaN n=1 Tax=Consotaella salsifontis TaxID=1365950 RepID=A0A1T4T7G9_9HYPH|nr:YhaN family protein [Consotaella salsifontis]SKA36289.1 Uncharacterized protein YhaN [Consotaella salsifontis]
MRLLRLDLLRYGAFTDLSLNFRRDARLHLVYGPNEAGKSSALAAIGDLLFGFGKQTQFDFLHDMKSLRVGAALASKDDRRIAFRRRKGNKNTLLSADDKEAALPDDALAPFLGGLSRDVFHRAFGLDSRGLRDGAEEMLKSDGEIGAAMFAAASGLKGLHDLRRALEDDADGISGTRAKQSRSLDQALERYRSARQEERDSELKVGTWKALNQRIDELALDLDGIRAERARAIEEKARLERLRRVAPCVSQIDADLAELATLGPMAAPHEGFAEDLSAALQRREGARTKLAEIQAAAAHARAAFESITVDEGLLKRADEITALFGETGGIRNNDRDLPRVVAERDAALAELGELASRLGYPDVHTLEERRPTAMACAAGRALIERGRDLKDRQAKNQALKHEEQERASRLLAEMEGRGHVADPHRFRMEFDAMLPDLRRLEGQSDLERASRERQRRLTEAAAQLNPSVADLDALMKAALPGEETVARYRALFAEVDDRRRSLVGRCGDLADDIARLEDENDRARGGGDLPSPDRIAEERSARRELWETIVAHLSGRKPLVGAALSTAITRYEHTVATADRLADEAVSDAARIARHADIVRRLAERVRDSERLKDQLDATEKRRGELVAEWDRLWVPAAVTPLPPAEMSVWLKAVASLRREREEALAAKAEAEDGRHAAERLRPQLSALAGSLDVAGAERLDVVALSRAVEAQIGALARRWEASRETAVKIKDAESRIARCESASVEIEAALAAWGEEWRRMLPSIGLQGQADIVAAGAALDVWDRVPQVIEARDKDARRVSGMQRDNGAFAQRLTYVAEAVAPDLVGHPAVEAAEVLNQRLAEARSEEARRAAARSRLKDISTEVEQAAEELANASAELARLVEHLPEGADPASHLERIHLLKVVRERLDERRRHLLSTSDGLDEAHVRAELESYAPDAAAAALEACVEADRHLEQRLQEVYAEWDRECRHRARLEEGTGAELAAFRRTSAEAELAAEARRWLVLKTGALLLSKAVERHRGQRRDPLMARAGALFRDLTAGAFSRLSEEFGEDDVPRLVGLRETGEAVPLEGLSEGTRDQLYLALRLAFLEDYANRAEAAPFIGDDLFMTFDDERTRRGLRALAAIGGTVQPILFTHHRHVAEVAQAELKGDLDLIDLG